MIKTINAYKGKIAFSLILIAVIYGIVQGTINMTNANNALKTDCVKTQMYVIGNKGHQSAVYDCSNRKID